mgnify:CR=1 FL=1
MKFLEHHCLVWSENGWIKPSGGKPRSNREDAPYSTRTGFGHEEWNGSDLFLKSGMRGFYTQAASEDLRDFAGSNRLGIVMTSRKPRSGRHYLIGIAVDVREDDESVDWGISEPKLIRDLLAVDDIWRRHGTNKTTAAVELRKEIPNFGPTWICQEKDFWWSSRPIPLREEALKTATGKSLTWRFAQSQSLSDARGVARILPVGMPDEIKLWLEGGALSIRSGRAAAPTVPRQFPRAWSNVGGSAREGYFRYIRSRIMNVRAFHTELQRGFQSSAINLGFRSSPVPGYRLVDLVGQHRDRGKTFIEVKPAETESDARFAVRLALAQLLEYCWLEKQENNNDITSRLIVLGCKPAEDVIAFAKSLNVGCAWRTQGAHFQVDWPE